MKNVDTRMQLHWAAQAAAGVGRTLLPPQPDDSHQSFTWSRRARALVQGVVEGRYRAGIRPRDMALLLLDDADRVTAELPLAGRTLDDGFRFYEEQVGRTLARPDAGIPAHPVASGAAFAPDSNELANLEALYDQANAILERIRASRRGSSEVRCWPHHFDLATLITLGGGRTVGIGFVPGDTQIAEPYWYVTPWPYPKDHARLPKLPIGSWNTEGWVGAVLRVREAPNEKAIENFVNEAIDHCMGLAGT
jgi:hypothetical protein